MMVGDAFSIEGGVYSLCVLHGVLRRRECSVILLLSACVVEIMYVCGGRFGGEFNLSTTFAIHGLYLFPKFV